MTVAVAIAICWIAALGLGSWFRVDGMGTRAFLGLAALPIALFVDRRGILTPLVG